jgi:hypothetical protein
VKRLTKEEVERELVALDALDAPALREKWKQLYRRDPPPRIRARLLKLGVAYRIQELALGGLKSETVRLLRKLAAELRAERRSKLTGSAENAAVPHAMSVAPRFSPGTQLMRSWNGSTQIIEVTTDGYVWRGSTYRTLSAVAQAITGTKWSGPKFFGLKKGAATKRSSSLADIGAP